MKALLIYTPSYPSVEPGEPRMTAFSLEYMFQLRTGSLCHIQNSMLLSLGLLYW